ncbi:DUF1580 domain-containing protein [Roseiconus lacunae]|uniref:DUF1580 domain-containing protein n=1 Tax=Roseiconus lacunae TaxID=2605694 RepID=UPI00135A4CFB|nr:DUF1580 domain-containing protein [Roseiconus lacunae]
MSCNTDFASQNVQKILTEDVLTLQDARQELRQLLGKRPDKTTLYRWCLRGVNGSRLEHVRIGNRILTSRQALTRFITARTANA